MKMSDIRREAEATWYRVPNADNVRVKIIIPKPVEVKKIIRACTTKKWKGGKPVETTNDEQANDLFIRKCIIDWEGIEEDDGTATECNFDNAKILIDNWDDFHTMWAAVLRKLGLEEYELQEAEAGNSENGENST